MSSLLSNLTLPNITATAFSPYLQGVHALSTAPRSLQARQDGSCIQTVEAPVWYGPDYNTCSMQTMTAACSVSFPAVSCHTHLPSRQPLSENGLPPTAQLWIIIGVSIFFVISIPVAVLWVRWRLGTHRLRGKRSINVQLREKRRCQTDVYIGSGLHPNLVAHAVRVTTNITIDTERPNRKQSPGDRHQRPEEPRPMSPRIALESLGPGHPLGQPPNQPWMRQDQSGRWEGYRRPGLPLSAAWKAEYPVRERIRRG